MDKTQLQDEMFHLITYIIASARGLFDEPADYGTFRLLDTAGRLLAIMEDQELLEDPFLKDLKISIDAEREGNMDSDRQVEHLDLIVQNIATEMQNRLEL
jgi:hypothetical protein